MTVSKLTMFNGNIIGNNIVISDNYEFEHHLLYCSIYNVDVDEIIPLYLDPTDEILFGGNSMFRQYLKWKMIKC